MKQNRTLYPLFAALAIFSLWGGAQGLQAQTLADAPSTVMLTKNIE